MSNYYDRTRNITGATELTGFVYNPSYGSSVSFTTKNNYIANSDKTVNIAPLGLNTVVGTYSLNLNLRKDQAKNLINFYESQTGTGIFAFHDNSNIYKIQSGTIDSLQNLESANNDKYNIGLTFAVERNSSVLNWSGQSFVDYPFVKWEAGIQVEDYDLVYFENDLQEPLNNFFYCTGGSHIAALSNHPLSTGQKWTNNLFLDNNDQFTVQQNPTVSKNDFQRSFVQRVNDQKNVHSLEQIAISYKNISDKKTKALLHFCESRLGYKRFRHQFPQIYDQPKTFFAPQWDHQWNYKDSNNFKISAIEDPLGLIPSGTPNIHLTQAAGRSSLSFSITGNGNLFYNTGAGKELITGSNVSISWPSSNRGIGIWGRVIGFTGSGQGLSKAQFSNVRNLENLNLSGNSISVLNLYDAYSLKSLICPNNSIVGFDLGGNSLLSYFDCSNNLSSYLNLNGASLTGAYCSGNRFPATHLNSVFSGLVAGGNSSGYFNFSGSSGVLASSLDYISTLTGKGWTAVYEYNPVSTTTTAAPATTTSAPISVTTGTINYAESIYDACYGGTSVDLRFDAGFGSATRVNFEGIELIESGASTFYLSDGFFVQECAKICCGIASMAPVQACPAPTTTSSTTTTVTTTVTTTTATTTTTMTTPPP